MWFTKSFKDLLPPSLASGSAADVASSANLGEQAQSLLEPQMNAGDYLATLMQQKQDADVVPFMAHLMPPEKGVEWAAQSSEMAAPDGPASPEAAKAIETAQAWIADPSPQTQQAAAQAAAAAPKNEPAAWAAQAAAWSGETGSPDAIMADAKAALANAGGEMEVPVVEMAESIPTNLTAKAVTGAVMLAAAKVAPDAVIPEIAPVPDLQESMDVDLPGAAEAEGLAQGVALVPPPTEIVIDKKQLAKTHKLLKPFIEKGLEVANSP